MARLNEFTLILPYYRAPKMLRLQLDTIADYPAGVRTIVIDDCSPEPAAEVLQDGDNVELYRIHDDIPWNRSGARNLGAHVATTNWILQTDMDHQLQAHCAQSLLGVEVDEASWYRFPRFRVGKADETRQKDSIPHTCTFGPVKPHIDSYLVTRDLYWKVGGYNEDFSGCLGGGSAFLKHLGEAGNCCLMWPDICLNVYTRHAIADASVSTLPRDRKEYMRRRKLYAAARPVNPMRFEWSKIR